MVERYHAITATVAHAQHIDANLCSAPSKLRNPALLG
jgi:hypothetical protein